MSKGSAKFANVRYGCLTWGFTQPHQPHRMPNACSSRDQWCDEAHASIASRHGGSFWKNARPAGASTAGVGPIGRPHLRHALERPTWRYRDIDSSSESRASSKLPSWCLLPSVARHISHAPPRGPGILRIGQSCAISRYGISTSSKGSALVRHPGPQRIFPSSEGAGRCLT